MKKSKKILSVLCAATLATSMSVAAFAQDTQTEDEAPITSTTGSNTETITVDLNGKVTAAADSYSVQILWESTTFTYNAQQGAWDTESHTNAPTTGSWSDTDGAKIVAINDSNKDVKVTATYAAEGDAASKVAQNSVNISLTNDGVAQTLNWDDDASQTGFNLTSHDGTSAKDWTLSVTGDPTDANLIGTSLKAGTVTLTVEAADE